MRCFENQFIGKYYDTNSIRILLDEGYADECWGNESCPRFIKNVNGEDLRIDFLVECIERDSREFDNQKQFTAMIKTVFDDDSGHIVKVFESEVFSEVIGSINCWRVQSCK